MTTVKGGKQPFDFWMEDVYPRIKVGFSTIPAKSRWFYDEKGKKVESAVTEESDQTMLSHVFNAVAAVHRLIGVLKLREKKVVSPVDELVAYASLTGHDMHKMEKNPETRATFGHVIAREDYEKLLRQYGFVEDILPAKLLHERVSVAIDHHHPVQSNVTTSLYEKPTSVLYDKDIAYHLLLLGDRVASAGGIEEAKRSIEETLKSIQAKVPGCKDLAWHFAYHETGVFDGDLVAIFHKFAESEMHRSGWEPMLYFPDGTLYYSPEEKSIDSDSIYSGIVEQIEAYLSDDVVQFGIQKNMVKIKTKKFTEKAGLRKCLTLLARSFPKVDLEKKHADLLKDIAAMGEENASWGKAFSSARFDLYTNITFLFLTAVEVLCREFGYLPGYDKKSYAEKDAAISLLLAGTDLSGLMGVLQNLDASGNRNPVSTPYHFIPLARVIQDKVYSAGISVEEYIEALYNFICTVLERANKPAFEAKTADVMTQKIATIVRAEIGINHRPAPVIDEDFGFSGYIKALENAPGKFDAKCFLCCSTQLLEPVNPDKVKMPLQIHSDRIPSGKTISASTVKKMCFRCFLKMTIRNKKYPWVSDTNADKVFYLTVTPNHVFTRDHEPWILPYIAGLFSLSKKSYSKVKKASEDELPVVLENELSIYTFIVSRIVKDLVYAASREGKIRTMHELLAGAVERSCSMNKLAEDQGTIEGIDIESERQRIIGSRYMQMNGFVLPFKFIDDDTNPTAMWFVASYMALLVAIVTGSRVTVTQDYGTIPLVGSNALITLDSPPALVERVLGSEIELSGGDLVKKFVKTALLLYINAMAIRPDEAKDNTIPSVIGQYITSPLKMIDWCWRYLDKSKKKSLGVFYRLFTAIDELNSSSP